MSNIWEQFDEKFNSDELQSEIKEAGKNSSYKEVPQGTYTVGVEKMDLVQSKKGDPMVSIWFTIKEGEFKNSKIFYNQVIKQGFGIHKNNELLRSMQLQCVEDAEEERNLFQSYAQYGDLLLDAAEEIEEYGLTFELEYGTNKNGYNTFKITDCFE